MNAASNGEHWANEPRPLGLDDEALLDAALSVPRVPRVDVAPAQTLDTLRELPLEALAHDTIPAPPPDLDGGEEVVEFDHG
jgi:hypothetical protein